MMDTLRKWLADGREKSVLYQKLDELDKGHREARHGVRGLQSQANYIGRLVTANPAEDTMLELLEQLQVRRNGRDHS